MTERSGSRQPSRLGPASTPSPLSAVAATESLWTTGPCRVSRVAPRWNDVEPVGHPWVDESGAPKVVSRGVVGIERAVVILSDDVVASGSGRHDRALAPSTSFFRSSSPSRSSMAIEPSDRWRGTVHLGDAPTEGRWDRISDEPSQSYRHQVRLTAIGQDRLVSGLSDVVPVVV